jgi:hypothetical protein
MRAPITQDEFDQLLANFSHSAFRLETRPAYELGYERAEFDRFLAGSPTPPPEVSWWRPWLDQIAALSGAGKTISRVRILTEPPTSYQQWELWAARWHAEAGEDIRYLPRTQAEELGVPLDHDWWLLDNERLIVMRYASGGTITDTELVTDKGVIALHDEWRNLAVRDAIPATKIVAA